METGIPLISPTIALAEKKMAMALDDIIKMSKRRKNVNKGKRSRRQKNKKRNSNGAAKENTSKVRHYVNTLSAVRQGAVVKRRNRFPRTAAASPPLSGRGRDFNARRIITVDQSRLVAPSAQSRYVHGRFAVKRQEVVDERVEKEGEKRKTLDSRFANMKEQRKRQKSNNYGVGLLQVPRFPPWARDTRFSH
ncbi:unnamed protein product [Cochlearia groenlandica]